MHVFGPDPILNPPPTRAGASVTVILGFVFVAYGHRSGDSLFCNVKLSLGGATPHQENSLRATNRGCAHACGGMGWTALNPSAGRERERERERQTQRQSKPKEQHMQQANNTNTP